VPLTGAAALRPDTPWKVEAWAPVFLIALADEAEDGLQLLVDMERIWFAPVGPWRAAAAVREPGRPSISWRRRR
jgi:hypothetical protein